MAKYDLAEWRWPSALSGESAVASFQMTSDLREKVYTLTTVSGVVVRVSPDLFRQATEMGYPLYLTIGLSREPGKGGEPIVCADVSEMERRLAEVKREAAQLAERLKDIAS